MLELLRRLGMLGALFCAIWFALTPEPALLAVGTVDFKDQHKRARFRDISLARFVEEKTKDRLVRVEGERWKSFFDDVSQTLEGHKREEPWRSRLSRSGGKAARLFFGVKEAPLAGIAANLNEGRPFVYLLLASPQGEPRYLSVDRQGARWAKNEAPSQLLFPRRQTSLWLLFGGVLFYAAVPWRRQRPEVVRYSRFRGAMLPDLIGCMMAGLFFALPIAIIASNSSDPSPFNSGWIVLTAVLWAMALGGMTFLGIAAWYEGYEIEVLGDRLRRKTLLGVQEFAFSEITEAVPYAYKPPRWLVVAGIVSALLGGWRATGTILIAATQRHTGLRLVCRDGRELKFWLTGLEGMERIFHALYRAGVPMDEELKTLVEEDLAAHGAR